jgi:uncharacterized membrane-anchored protein
MNKNLLSCIIFSILTLVGVIAVFYFIDYGVQAFFYLYLIAFSGGFTAYYQYDLYDQSKRRRWEE